MGLKEYVRETRERPEFRFAFPVAEVAKRAGEVLRNLRSNSEKKQEDIAKELDISQPRMSQIESGKVEHLPSLALMAKYAEVCGDAICILPKSELDALVEKAKLSRHRSFGLGSFRSRNKPGLIKGKSSEHPLKSR